MSFRKIAAIVVACAALALGYSLPSALANQAPATSYCTAPNILYSSPPREISATPLDTNFAHAEVCGGQYGDWLTDGPIYPITISFSGSSFNFNIPQNDWVVKGQRIANALVSETAATSNTTYCYINWVTSAWTCNLSSSPPNSFSILGYTVVANGSGITSITNATPAAALFNSITDSSLIGNDGCLNVTSGVIGSTGTACGSGGGGGGTIVAGNCLSATPTASPTGATLVAYTCATPTTAPSPTASNGPTSGPGQCAFTGINLNCLFQATSSPVPSPTSSNTAGPCDTLTNTGFSFLLTGNGTCSGGGGIAFTTPYPAATPSVYPPANSALGLGQIIIGDAPFSEFTVGPPTPSPYPEAILVQNGVGQCEGGNYSEWGTSGTTVAGVPGQVFAVACLGETPYVTIGNHGDVGSQANFLALNGFYAGASKTYDGNTADGFWVDTSTSTGYPCGFYGPSAGNQGVQFGPGGTPSPNGTCQLGIPYIGANNAVCTGGSTSTGGGSPPYALVACASAAPGGETVVAGTCISVTPTASPSGGVIVAVSGSGCTPSPFPSPTASSGPTTGPGSCSFSGYNLNCLFQSTPTPAPVPTATNVSAPCDTLTTSGYVFTLTGGGTCSGGGGLALASSAPSSNPSPYPGFLQVQGGIYVGPAAAPSASPNAKAYQFSAASSCTTDQFGSTASNINGIVGVTAAWECGGTLEATLDQNGNIGATGYVGTKYSLYANSSLGTNCTLADNGTAGWQIGSVSGVCPLTLQSTATQNKGQLTCTLSTLTCTQTATVISGAKCVATLDTTATTATLGLFTVVSVAVSSTTLTITFEATSGASGTVGADYLCL